MNPQLAELAACFDEVVVTPHEGETFTVKGMMPGCIVTDEQFDTVIGLLEKVMDNYKEIKCYSRGALICRSGESGA